MVNQLGGDCYQVHAETILNNCIGMLCHGTVWHPDTGWHGHCWIELNKDMVLDVSNGHNFIVRRENYYTIGKIKDIQKYTPKQVRELVIKFENYGPWETR